MDDIVIFQEMTNTLRENPQILRSNGLLQSVFATDVFSNKLKEKGIEHSIITGQFFRSSAVGSEARRAFAKTITKLKDVEPGSDLAKLKECYCELGRVPHMVSHTALAVGNIVYDVTSGQYGLPNKYSLSLFIDLWVNFDIKGDQNKKSGQYLTYLFLKEPM